MGVEYHLIKIDHGTYFDLGKGLWGALPCENPFLMPQLFDTPSALSDELEGAMERWGWEFASTSERFLYAVKLSNKLFDWCKWDRLLCLSDQNTTEYVLNPYYVDRYGALFRPDYDEPDFTKRFLTMTGDR